VRVILLGDTHLPRFGRRLPRALEEGLADADLILHAGDITEPFVLDLLGTHAPTVAVAGNNDPPELVERLGLTRVVEVEGIRIGLTHGHAWPGRTTAERARRTFADADPPVDAIAFGHSHQPMVERVDGVWMLNPGSPTDRRRQPRCSYLRVEVDGADLRPELVTFDRRGSADP
jgi:putative phosphoesterase